MQGQSRVWITIPGTEKGSKQKTSLSTSAVNLKNGHSQHMLGSEMMTHS